jgi:hypothetical protein
MNSVDYTSSDFSLQGLWNVIKQPFKSTLEKEDSTSYFLNMLKEFNDQNELYEAMMLMLSADNANARNAVGRFLEEVNCNKYPTINSINFGYNIIDKIQNELNVNEHVNANEEKKLAISIHFLVENQFFEEKDLNDYMKINNKLSWEDTQNFLEKHQIFTNERGKFNKHLRNQKQLPRIRTVLDKNLKQKVNIEEKDEHIISLHPVDTDNQLNDNSLTLRTINSGSLIKRVDSTDSNDGSQTSDSSILTKSDPKFEDIYNDNCIFFVDSGPVIR